MEIRDCDGSAARFDAQGALCWFRSHGQEWPLAAPSVGWNVGFEVAGQRRVAAAGAAPAAVEAGDDRVRFVFDRLRLDDGTTVAGRVEADWWLADGLLQGRLTVAEWPATMRLVDVTMPEVTVTWDDPAATRLTVPYGLGHVLSEAAVHLFRQQPAVTFGTTEFQCYGWAEGAHGLYLDTRDPEGWIKRWRFARAADQQLRIEATCVAPSDVDAQAGFALPYPVSLGGYNGHWYDLGRIYRRWALTQQWASRGPDQRRDSYFAEVACWLWNRGPAARVAPPAKELARRLDAPVALDWYWWHQHGYDTEYPDYFPPREGEPVFRAAVRDLQANGVRVQVYTNGMAIDQDGGAWLPAGPDSALVLENGEYQSHMFNTFTKRRLAFACGAAPVWHDTVSRFVAQARALGLDGLYLDMIGNAGGYQTCHSHTHDHAPGGGSYGRRGFRALLARVRAEHPGFPISTEATQEHYLDLSDGNIILDTSAERWAWHRRGGCPTEVVPLFGSIYHGHAVCFGNYAFLDGIPPFDDLWPQEYRLDPSAEQDWHALCPDQFAFEAARTVAFGIQPMICNLTEAQLANPDLAGDVDFLVALARCYHANREHLLWGEMLPPGELHGPHTEVAFLQRYIFTAPGEEKIERLDRPAVLHSAWRAPAGDSLVVLINYSRQPADVEYAPAGGWRVGRSAESGWTVTNGRLCGCLPARTILAVPLEPSAAQ